MARRRGQAGRFGGILRNSLGLGRAADRPTAPTAFGAVTYRWDLGADTLAWGPNAPQVFGLDDSALPRTGEAFSRMIESDVGPGWFAVLCDAQQDRPSGLHPYEARYVLRIGSDRTIVAEDSGRFLPDAEGRPAMARGMVRLRPRSSSSEAPSAAAQARSGLLTRLRDDVEATRGSRRGLTVIVGLLEGDDATGTLMTEVEQAIRPLLRRGDHLARYAPNRFALALASCAFADAESAMKRLVLLVETSSFVLSEHLRLGAACAPEHATDALTLLRRAEDAVESAVEHSLRFTTYTARPRPYSGAGTSPLDVIEALNDRRLAFTRQPVVDALTRRSLFKEALPCVVGPDGSPGQAQDLACAMEDAGLSLLLDGRMLELVATELALHPRERLVLPVSPTTLLNPEWLDLLAAHLGARPGIASRLMVLLPEAALTDVEAAHGRLDAMKALGIGLAAQGFGTGHLACRQLRNLPLDLLKIDGPFIRALGRSPEERLFVRTLIETAHQLGMATVAEWVEDETTARMLAEWGVDYLQGGLFGAPALPAGSRPRLARRA